MIPEPGNVSDLQMLKGFDEHLFFAAPRLNDKALRLRWLIMKMFGRKFWYLCIDKSNCRRDLDPEIMQHPKKYETLKMPSYPGGKKAFQEFIGKNLLYPKEAQEANIQGSVIVGYEITDNGIVQNPHIIKGLGYGCDEEAIRVIGLLRYEKVRNKRVRVKMTTKTTLHFNLSKLSLNYSVTEAKKPEQPDTSSASQSGEASYTYTINF